MGKGLKVALALAGATVPVDGSYAAATTDVGSSRVTADTNPRFIWKADGKLEWGPGNAALDVNLYRSAANTLKTDDKLHVALELELDGDLNHDGTNVGFMGAAPAPRQASIASPTSDVIGTKAAVDALITRLEVFGFINPN